MRSKRHAFRMTRQRLLVTAYEYPPHCAITISRNAKTFSSSSSSSSSSVFSHEVDKFSAMDAQWWDARHNPLISMNVARMQYISSHGIDGLNLNKKKQEKGSNTISVLDIGCGGGLLCESLARLLSRGGGGGVSSGEEAEHGTAAAARVVGLDPSPQLIAAARAHAQLDPITAAGIDYQNTTVEEFAIRQEKGSFDIVCLLEVVEHVRNVDSILQVASSLLRKDGRLFVSTMNRTLISYLLTILGAEYVMRYLPIGTHDWSLYKTPQEVEQLMRKYGLEQLDVSGMVVDSVPPFGWKWRLDPKDTDVNWIGTYRKVAD